MRPRHRLTAALLGLALCAASIKPARAQEAEPSPPAPLMVPAPAPAQVAVPLPPAPLMVPAPAQPPPPPQGGISEEEMVPPAVVFVALALLGADVGFYIHDGVRAGQGAAPTRGVAIAQAVVTAPHVLAFEILDGVVSAEGTGDGGHVAGLVFLPGIADSLFVHGIWAAQTPSVPPGALLGVSTAIGFDTALTTSMLTRAGTGHLSGLGMGVVQMVLTAPQIAASSYGLARDPRNLGGWAALTAWSGAIFTHGLVSAIAAGRSSEREPLPPPPPPPPVPERPTLMVPASLHFGPIPIAGGGGVGLSGQWL